MGWRVDTYESYYTATVKVHFRRYIQVIFIPRHLSRYIKVIFMERATHLLASGTLHKIPTTLMNKRDFVCQTLREAFDHVRALSEAAQVARLHLAMHHL